MTADRFKVTPLPVRPLVPTLPLHELAPDIFEQFSADLAQYLYPAATVHRYGGQGHKQYGIDVEVDHHIGKPTGIQCKREQQFGPGKVRKAIDELKLDVRECYIYLTRVASPDARKEILKHDNWRLWDVNDISRAVRNLSSEIAVRLVDAYFPGWRGPFLGVSAPGCWLTCEEFFRSSSGERIYSHGWELVGRDDELGELVSFVLGRDRIGALVGRGGLGKTRLLRSMALEAEHSHETVVRFISQGAPVRPEDYDLLPRAERLLIIIDDAHDRNDIATLIADIDRVRPDAKIFLSMRPYGAGQLAADLRRIGLHLSELPTWQLKELKASGAEILARNILGSEFDDRVVLKLANVGTDCPLLIVVGAALIKRGRLDPERLESSTSIRDEILGAFRDALVSDPVDGDFETRREVLNAIAVTQPFRSGDEEFQAAIAKLAERPYDRIVHHLRSLEDAGILLRRGESLRIVPDLLGDAILARAVIDERSGAPTGYVERVHHVANGEALQHVLINASRIDWQVRGTVGGNASIVDALWSVLDDEIRIADAQGRLAILSVLKRVAFFQPGRTLALNQWIIDHPTDEEEDTGDLLAALYSPSHKIVLRELPPLLESIAYNFEYLPHAVDLLWSLAQADNRPINQNPEHPIRVLRELAGYDVAKPLVFNETIASAAERWLQQNMNPDSHHSPFDVLEELLATEGVDRRADGLTLTFKPFSINADAVFSLRERVVDLALREARSRTLRRAVRAVGAIGDGMRYPTGAYGRTVGVDEWGRWTSTFVDILRRINELSADAELHPIVAIAVRHAIHWHAHYSQTETRAVAQSVIERMPTSLIHSVALALHDGWGHLLDEYDDFHEAERKRQARFDAIAAAVVAQWQDEVVVDHLAELLAIDREAFPDGSGHPGPFVWTLVGAKPSLGGLICQRAGEAPSSSLLELIPVALSRFVEAEPSEAMRLTRDLLSVDSIDMTRSVAHAFGWSRGSQSHLIDGEADLLKTFSQHSDVSVRCAAIAGARRIVTTERDLAMELVTTARFRDAKPVAREVFSALGPHGYVSWSDLTESQANSVIQQLRECIDIDDYRIMQFLSSLSETEPRRVLGLLMSRVERSEDSEATSSYRALPYSWHVSMHFRDHSEFAEYLRAVRDWVADGLTYNRRRRAGADIFRLISEEFDEKVIAIIDEGVASGDTDQVRAVGSLLRRAPRTLVWEDVDFVRRVLNSAARQGEDLVRAVSEGFYAAITNGTRSGTPGQPFQEDIEQRDRSLEVARTLRVGTIERDFYESLVNSAQRSIEWNADRDEAFLDRRDW